ncbi:MAG TPA: ATP-binding protein [Actinomycetota bacterium]|nr:ATP-binding protein [Actinomycetota bacterium]
MEAGAWLAVAALAAVVAAGIAALRIRELRRSAAEIEARAASAEHALDELRRHEEEERRVRELVLSTMRDGILLIAPDGGIAFANEAIERHLGGTPASLDALLPLRLREAVVASRRRDEPRSILVETGVPSRWLGCSITPAVDDHILVVVRDVTEQRRLDAVRRDFVENASHELKTPAATIQATAETLRRAALDDPGEIPRFAERLEREAIRLSRLVADLLDLSRLGSGSPLDEDVSLTAIAEEERRRLQPDADGARVTLELRVDGRGAMRGSSKDLSLLVRNLVDNAIRYSGEGDKVLVEIEGDERSVVLRVRDTGIGIPTRDLSRIFERFYRVDRARSRETGGTGLGLAIVKHVVENHGGRTTVESELGRGTTFEVTLPAGSGDADTRPSHG